MITLNEVEISCCKCGCIFWIPKLHNDELLRTQKSFFCPNGHSQSYIGETDKTKLEKANATKDKYLVWYNDEARKVNELNKKIRSYKGVITKLKKTKKKVKK